MRLVLALLADQMGPPPVRLRPRIALYPNRALTLASPLAEASDPTPVSPRDVRRRDLLGGSSTNTTASLRDQIWVLTPAGSADAERSISFRSDSATRGQVPRIGSRSSLPCAGATSAIGSAPRAAGLE